MGKGKKEFATIKAVCNSELHEKFKEKCRKKDIQMNKVIIKLVKAYINSAD